MVVAVEINRGSVLHWCRAIILLTNNSCACLRFCVKNGCCEEDLSFELLALFKILEIIDYLINKDISK